MDSGQESDELAELEARFRFHRRLEVEAEARDLHEEHERRQSFRDFLLELPRGLVVGVVTLDGTEIWGRVDAVGVDKVRVAETSRDPNGAATRKPRRVHDIRLDAVARVIREAGEVVG